jgi:LacI family transcriptional regulator
MAKIAECAGVDRSTVSLALRNDRRLKPATREKIQLLAAQMGYRQNPTLAQLMSLLRAGQKKHFQSTIAVLNFGKPTVGSNGVLAGAQARAKDLGYEVAEFNGYEVGPRRLEQILATRGIRGILISSRTGQNVLPKGYDGIWKRFSCCVVGLRPEDEVIHFVADDHYITMITAMRQLHQIGFRKIGLAMHDGINHETEYRFMGGYFAAVNHCCPGLKIIPTLLLKESIETKGAFISWFEQHRPQVIVCIQKEPLDWLREAGYRVPQEVSLVNLDLNSAGKGWAGMRQDEHKCGEMAIEDVIAQLSNAKTAFQKATLIESHWEFGDTLEAPV